MKKSLLALAALGAFAGAASAQSTVTLFGTIDVAAESQKTTNGLDISATDRKLANNRQGTSQLSIRVVEDLGGGTKAIALWEGDFDATQNTTNHAAGAGGGEVFVGLEGGFGRIRLGSPNTPTLSSQAARQPFSTKLGSGFGGDVLGSAQVRQNHAIRYDTPNMGGLTASIDAAAMNDNPTRGRVYDLGLNYAAGPLNAWLTYYKQTLLGTKLLTLQGSYDFGRAVLMLGFHKESSDPGGTNNKGVNIAGKVLVSGQLNILANYARLNDTNVANLDKTIFAIGPQYVLSPRSSIYARVVEEKNNNVAATAAAVKSVTSFLVGMQHNF